MQLRSKKQLPFTPAARIRVQGSCGTGTHVAKDDEYSYWLTNAHVVGTRLGRTAIVEVMFGNAYTSLDGTVIAASYKRGMSNDFAIVRTKRHASIPTPILIDNVNFRSITLHSGGSPRCEPTSWKYRNVVRESVSVQYSTPNAIGGESGSGILDPTGRVLVGLLTWSANGQCAAQRSSLIANTLLSERAYVEPIDNTFVPACDNPQICDDSEQSWQQASAWPQNMFVTLEELEAYDRENDNGENESRPEPPSQDDAETAMTLREILALISKVLELLQELTPDENDV